MKSFEKLESLVCSLAKGQFVNVVTTYPTDKMDSELYKKIGGMPNPMFGRITKRTEYQGVRVCDYESLADVVAERAEGKEAKEPWYKWISFPFIAEGKKNGNRYMVVKPTINTAYKVKYFVDGTEVEYAEIAQYFKAKSRSEESPRMLTLQLDFIDSVKQGSIVYNK